MSHLRANELLGYPADARLLIVNADDFGVSHAVNAAVLRTFTDGIVRSTTLMAPCPWALHAMRLVQDHPDITCGVHLTVVSEFADYRWGPLAPRERVPSLLDETGYFYSNDRQAELLARARLDELEIEFRAQIEAVLSGGLKPTHLDWHCLYDGGRDDVFDLTVGLAGECGLALRVFDATRSEHLQQRGLPAADHGVVDSTRLATANKTARFVRMLRELPAGLSEWAVHPGLGTAEARAIDGWWAKRAADVRFLVSREARETVAAEGIVLLDYRALQAIWARPRAWDDGSLTPVPLSPWRAGLPSLGLANEPGNGEVMADNNGERAPAVTLHLVPEDVWLAQEEESRYRPEGFSSEGFIHCTHGHDFVIEVGNRYYRDDPRPYLVLEVDLKRVVAPVVYEDDERRFPHIYGPLERHAVRRVCRVERAADGTFIAIGEPATQHFS